MIRIRDIVLAIWCLVTLGSCDKMSFKPEVATEIKFEGVEAVSLDPLGKNQVVWATATGTAVSNPLAVVYEVYYLVRDRKEGDTDVSQTISLSGDEASPAVAGQLLERVVGRTNLVLEAPMAVDKVHLFQVRASVGAITEANQKVLKYKPETSTVQFNGIRSLATGPNKTLVVSWDQLGSLPSGLDPKLVSFDVYVQSLPDSMDDVLSGAQSISGGLRLFSWLTASSDLGQLYQLSASSQLLPKAELAPLVTVTGKQIASLKDELPLDRTHVFMVRARLPNGLSDTNTNAVVFRTETFRFSGLKPENVIAAPDASKVSMTWDPATGSRTQVRYVVYSDQNFSHVLATTTETKFDYFNPIPASRMVFGVRAQGDAGMDGNKNWVQVDIPDTHDYVAPNFNGCSEARAVSDHKIELQWIASASDANAIYKIYASDNLSSPLAATRDTAYTMSNLTAGQAYEFVVRAEDASGNMDSNTAACRATTLVGSYPNFAGLLAVEQVPGIAGLTSLKLRWGLAGEPVSGYNIYGVADPVQSPGTLSLIAKITDARVTSYQINGLASDRVYSYVVRAYTDSSGVELEELNQVLRSNRTQVYRDPVFQGLTSAKALATASGFTSVRLDWGSPSTGGYYDAFLIEYELGSCNSGFSTSPYHLNLNDLNLRTYTVEQLQPNTRYRFRVRTHLTAANQPGSLTLCREAVTTPVAPHGDRLLSSSLLAYDRSSFVYAPPSSDITLGGLYNSIFLVVKEGDETSLRNYRASLGTTITATEIHSTSLDRNFQLNGAAEQGAVLRIDRAHVTMDNLNIFTLAGLRPNHPVCVLAEAVHFQESNESQFLESTSSSVLCSPQTVTRPNFSGVSAIEGTNDASDLNQFTVRWGRVSGLCTSIDVSISKISGQVNFAANDPNNFPTLKNLGCDVTSVLVSNLERYSHYFVVVRANNGPDPSLSSTGSGATILDNQRDRWTVVGGQDMTPPYVLNVDSSDADAYYRAGSTIHIKVNFSELVKVVDPAKIHLALRTGATPRLIDYASGNETDSLDFVYTVQGPSLVNGVAQEGDNSQDLDYTSSTALILEPGAAITDLVDQPASLTLPTAGSINSLAGRRTLIIDTKEPTPPSSVGFHAAQSNNVRVDFSWLPSTDLNLDHHNVKLCTLNTCSSGCIAPSTVVGTTAQLMAQSGQTYYACVQGEDRLGQKSAWMASAQGISVDTSSPGVRSVTSLLPDGYYPLGADIDIQVRFSEPVFVSNPSQVNLELQTGSTQRAANYLGGHGTDTLVFRYTVQANDVSSDLEVRSVNALRLGTQGAIRDAADNDAAIDLPELGSSLSLSGSKELRVDSVVPTTPTQVQFAMSTTASRQIALGWNVSTDLNFSEHRVKLCTLNDCNTGCTGEQAIVGGAGTLTVNADGHYYGCVLGMDLAQNRSSWGTTASAIEVDSIAPAVTSVTTAASAGYYKAGDTLDINVNFSEIIQLEQESGMSLLLETGLIDRAASYVAGAGTSQVKFRYVVQEGDVTSDLNYVSTNSFRLGAAGAIRDAAGNLALTTLPAVDSGLSLAGTSALVVDTAAPTSPSSVGFASAVNNSLNVGMSWVAGTDLNFLYHEAKLCASNDCSTGCSASSTTPNTQISFVAANASYYGCIRAVDLARNSSPWIPSVTTVTVDTTAPVITSVTSTLADGLYKTGDTIPISVVFSEPLFVTDASSIRLNLETGAIDRQAFYASGSGTSTLVFNYLIQAGDSSADLDYIDTNPLVLGTGTIQDAAHNNANLTTFAPGTGLSLGAQKNIAIDTAAPTVVRLRAPGMDGLHQNPEVITLHMEFTEPVQVLDTNLLGLQLETGSIKRIATYRSGSGTNTLVLEYTIQSGDSSQDLDYAGISALTAGSGPNILDMAGNQALLSLPVPGSVQSLAGGQAIVVDTTTPTAPSSVGFAVAVSSSTAVEVAWVPSMDANFLRHNIKLCTARDCATSCLNSQTSLSSPFVATAAEGQDYYACVQGEDTLGHKSAWVASLQAITVDTVAPEIVSVSSSTADGYYMVGSTIDIQLAFSKTVSVNNTNQIHLDLETGGIDRSALYLSGHGTSTLTFRYTVQSGDTSDDLELLSTQALSLGASGRIIDHAGNAAVLTLPALGSPQSLSGSKHIRIDTTAPTAPGQVTFASARSGTPNVSVSFSASTDSNLKEYRGKLCLYSDCLTSCLSEVSAQGSPLSLSGAGGTQYYACVRGVDQATNTSSWTASGATVDIDTTGPNVVAITSLSPNGFYKVGDRIDLQVSFSEATVADVGTGIQLLLETGTVDRNAVYVSGSGTNLLVFRYTVQAGDSSADLNVQSTSALSLLAGASLTDTLGNAANLTLPSLSSAQSLASAANLMIDTQAPSPPSAVVMMGNQGFSNSADVQVNYTLGSDTYLAKHEAKLCAAGNCSTGCTGVSASLDSSASSISVMGALNATYYACVRSVDLVGNFSPWVASSSSLTLEATAPTVTAVGSSLSSLTKQYFKTGSDVSVYLDFSEPVQVTGTSIYLGLETGLIDRQAVYVGGSGTNRLVFTYTVAAGDTSDDLDIASTGALTIGAASIRDFAGNDAVLTLPAPGSASALAALWNLVVDTTAPTVPSNIVFTGGETKSSLTVNFTSGTDLNFKHNRLNLCTNAACTAGCTSQSTALAGPVVLEGVSGLDYYACAQSVDESGNVSALVASASTKRIDGEAPTLSSSTITAGVGDSFVNLSWVAAIDNRTAAANLEYAVYSSSSNNILTAATAMANGTLVSAFSANKTSLRQTGLTSGSTLYWTVVVRDQMGNATAYTSKQTVLGPVLISSGTEALAGSASSAERRSFYDSLHQKHWTFYRKNSKIFFATAKDSAPWSEVGSLDYSATSFFVTSETFGGKTWVYLVVESNDYDILLLRGEVLAGSISFESPITVFDGTGSSDAYSKPSVALSKGNHYVWVSAVHRTGQLASSYISRVRRSSNPGHQLLSGWEASSDLGGRRSFIGEQLILPRLDETMIVLASDELNFAAWQYDGNVWSTQSMREDSYPFVDSTSGFISKVVLRGNELYIGGSFELISNGRAVRNLARWDGSQWQPIGGGVNGNVSHLTVDASGNVYIFGSFTKLGNSAISYAAKWNGTVWSSLGSFTSNSLTAVTAHPSTGYPAILTYNTCLSSSCGYIFRWTGTTWQSASEFGLSSASSSCVWSSSSFSSYQSDLAYDASGNLYFAGACMASNGTTYPGNFVLRSNGTNVSVLDNAYFENMATYVPYRNKIRIHPLTGTPYICNTTQLNWYSSVGVWTGTSWSVMGGEANSSDSCVRFGPDGTVYLLGNFSSIGTSSIRKIAEWSGSNWITSSFDVSSIPILDELFWGNDGTVYISNYSALYRKKAAGLWEVPWTQALSIESLGPMPTISQSPIATVFMNAAEDIYIPNYSGDRLYRYTGLKWFSDIYYGSISPSLVMASLLGNEGSFYWASSAVMKKAAGSGALSRVGSLSGNIYTLAQDSNGLLYAGGVNLNTSGNIAQFDGSTWLALGSGVNGTVGSIVSDGIGGLIVGGSFTAASGTAVSNIARWDGSAWSTWGTLSGALVYSLAYDSAGTLFAGTSAGVYRFDGSVWVGTGWNSNIRRVKLGKDGKFYALAESGNNPLRYWSGGAWVNVAAVSSIAGVAYDFVVNSLGEAMIVGSSLQVNGIASNALYTGSLIKKRSSSRYLSAINDPVSGDIHLLTTDSVGANLSYSILSDTLSSETLLTSNLTDQIALSLDPDSSRVWVSWLEQAKLKLLTRDALGAWTGAIRSLSASTDVITEVVADPYFSGDAFDNVKLFYNETSGASPRILMQTDY